VASSLLPFVPNPLLSQTFNPVVTLNQKEMSIRESTENMHETYHATLQEKSEEELDHLHKLNMSQLDDLNRRLKESMTVLNAT